MRRYRVLAVIVSMTLVGGCGIDPLSPFGGPSGEVRFNGPGSPAEFDVLVGDAMPDEAAMFFDGDSIFVEARGQRRFAGMFDAGSDNATHVILPVAAEMSTFAFVVVGDVDVPVIATAGGSESENVADVNGRLGLQFKLSLNRKGDLDSLIWQGDTDVAEVPWLELWTAPNSSHTECDGIDWEPVHGTGWWYWVDGRFHQAKEDPVLHRWHLVRPTLPGEFRVTPTSEWEGQPSGAFLPGTRVKRLDLPPVELGHYELDEFGWPSFPLELMQDGTIDNRGQFNTCGTT